MATHFHNITGETTQQLLAQGTKTRVKLISLTNVHASNTCAVDLHIADCEGKYYLLKGVNLPIGTTLVHDILNFDTGASLSGFGLFIKLTKSASETPAVDVILE